MFSFSISGLSFIVCDTRFPAPVDDTCMDPCRPDVTLDPGGTRMSVPPSYPVRCSEPRDWNMPPNQGRYEIDWWRRDNLVEER